jgi:hypothetical protein
VKLFVWDQHWKEDYSSGVLVILAATVERACAMADKLAWGEQSAGPPDRIVEIGVEDIVVVDESGGS